MYKDANVAHGLLQYDGTIGDSVKHLAGMPLLFNPGDRFEYSLGVDALGYLVEVLSGKPLDEFFRTRIFAPLGMHDNYFYPPEDKVKRLATAYTWYPEQGLGRFPDAPISEGAFTYSADYPYRGPKKLFAGGAGLRSTAMDYARFCQMMLDGGKADGAHLISRKTVELMTSDRLGKIGPDQGFGLGFGVDGVKAPLEELGSPGEYNWGGFFYTAFVVDPKEQMITIFMAQLHPAGDLNARPAGACGGVSGHRGLIAGARRFGYSAQPRNWAKSMLFSYEASSSASPQEWHTTKFYGLPHKVNSIVG